MPSIAERMKRNPKLVLSVKQYRAVLDFTTALEDEMVRREMSQSRLAEILGKSRAWVSKVFRRKPNVTFFTAVELADAVGMDLHVDLVPRHEVANIVFTRSLQVPNLEPANTPADLLPETSQAATLRA